MEDEHAGGRGRGRALAGLAVAVVVVGLLVRSPVTLAPDGDGPSGLAPTGAEPGPSPSSTGGGSADLEAYEDLTRAGTWSTVGVLAPLNPFSPGPSVWTGSELVVGFTPEVAAYTPTQRASLAWLSLPAHPAGALQVHGVTHLGGVVYVHGHLACSGCPFENSLFALDPVEAAWQRLPDAPGPQVDDAQVLNAGGRVVVVRDRAGAGTQALAFDPATSTWQDLGLATPALGGALALGVGGDVLLVGRLLAPAGGGATGAVLLDPSPADPPPAAGPPTTWRPLPGPVPLAAPDRAVAVVGDGLVVFMGRVAQPDGTAPGSAAEAFGGVALELSTQEWRVLPPLPTGAVGMPDLSAVRSVDGLAGFWDGRAAGFVGGLATPVFVAWVADQQAWQVRTPTRPRAGGEAWWTGEQVLLWGGFDRAGPVQDLQVFPARP